MNFDIPAFANEIIRHPYLIISEQWLKINFIQLLKVEKVNAINTYTYVVEFTFKGLFRVETKLAFNSEKSRF